MQGSLWFALLAVIEHNGVIVTARDDSLAIGAEAVDLVRIFAEYLGDAEAPQRAVSFMVAIAYHDKELNPKKMISEQIQPDLYTNDECVAIYKGAPFEVKGKGMCRAQTMANSGIK